MLESFGARLRQRREEQQISLAAIAERTKIKASLLEALERDDVSHWPAGIFRRAFLRAYAQAIGLDPEVALREFLDVHPEPPRDLETGLAVALESNGGHTNSGPPTRLRYIVGSAIGSLSWRRRNPAVDGLGLSYHAPVSVPAEPDLPLIADPFPDSGPVERADDIVVDDAPVDDAPVDNVPVDDVPVDDAPADLSAAFESDTPAVADPPDVMADSAPMNAPVPSEPIPTEASSEPDLAAVARLCTEFSRVENINGVQSLLQEAAGILDAIGLIVWVWDAPTEELRPALVYGYSDKVVAQLPAVRRDADNATAAAFRLARTCAINGGDHTRGALVVPLLSPGGCNGVLAIELQDGCEQTKSVRAVATIFAALLAQLLGGPRSAEILPQPQMIVPPVGNFLRGNARH